MTSTPTALGSKTESLQVDVEETMFVTCLPSPRNAMEHLRRNSQSSGTSYSKGSVTVENSIGSAKKVSCTVSGACFDIIFILSTVWKGKSSIEISILISTTHGLYDLLLVHFLEDAQNEKLPIRSLFSFSWVLWLLVNFVTCRIISGVMLISWLAAQTVLILKTTNKRILASKHL